MFMLVLNRPGFDPAPGTCPAGPPSGFQPARIKAHAAAKGKGKAACHHEYYIPRKERAPRRETG